MSDDNSHSRPDQAEEPADDMGASNVDLDEARHGPSHASPAAPEPGHEATGDTGPPARGLVPPTGAPGAPVVGPPPTGGGADALVGRPPAPEDHGRGGAVALSSPDQAPGQHGSHAFVDDHDDAHDDHDDHPVDRPAWVLAPLLVALLVGLAIVILLGLQSDANPFHQIG